MVIAVFEVDWLNKRNVKFIKKNVALKKSFLIPGDRVPAAGPVFAPAGARPAVDPHCVGGTGKLYRRGEGDTQERYIPAYILAPYREVWVEVIESNT